jgi:predicted N-acetyltransferase YhbS
MLEAPARRVGTTELRTLTPGTPEYRRWIDICADAYPTMDLSTAAQRDAAFEEQADRASREPEQRLVGAFRAGVLVGGMRVYDFTMCVRGAQVSTGGVGSIAVGLEHKRRGIARDLVRGFLTDFRERGAGLAVLYAFRPSFYSAMGFGYGQKINQYRIALDALPADGSRERVRALRLADAEAFLAAYNRAQARTNGLIRREVWRAEARLSNAAYRTFGYTEGGVLRGYLTVEVRLGKPGTMNRNDLYVHELVYETPAALHGLLSFARSQADQYAALIVNTHDPDFHFAVLDPRNGLDRNLYPPAHHGTNAQGLGVMYRALDARALVNALHECRFGDLDAIVRIDLADPFVAANAGACAIRFRAGRPELVDAAPGADVDVAIGVADFSALVMGSVRLRSLVAYGRAVLSKPSWHSRLDAAFDTDPPQCLTRF